MTVRNSTAVRAHSAFDKDDDLVLTTSAVSGFVIQCGDKALGRPCSSTTIHKTRSVKFPDGLDYCMTDIYQDGSGNVHVFKRCVDENTVITKWI